jgi:hypothetical protein
LVHFVNAQGLNFEALAESFLILEYRAFALAC